MPLVELSEFQRAATILHGVAIRTPLLPSEELEEQLGVPVFLKPDCLQRTGSFKFRGAYWFLSQLSELERARGLVAPSSGNHGQAVARAAKLFGTTVTVVMPTTTPTAKVEGARRLGATVVFEGVTSDERMARAITIRDASGATLVPPADDRTILTAQGTLGLEILDDLEGSHGITGPITVLVQVGGGGLAAGVAAAVKQRAPQARVIVVEPSGSPKLTQARAAGEPVTIPANPGGLADALLSVRIGTTTFEHLKAFADDVVTVDDSVLGNAVKFLLERQKLVVEPSGAITVAALLEGVVQPSSPVVCVLSGGNLDWPGLKRVLE